MAKRTTPKTMMKFAKARLKESERKKRDYSKNGWEPKHADYMKSEAEGEIIIWTWVVESLTEILSAEK
jgi:hypothetical protein